MDDRPGGAAWRRVDELFAAALEREPAARPAFLEEACADEPEIRAAVEELLAAAEEAGGFVARSEAAVAAAARHAFAESGAEEDLRPGRRVGPYRVVRRIARGGMGTVYLAERADGRFEQRVAIKVLRRGLDTEDVLARFRAERQILASLSHPRIARLLDGGATESGRPYLVMEYVEGEPIDAFCDDNRTSVGERLRLFRQVCDAVAHAHQNLVVHRDLKPSNVLVTDEDVPKLLDFGIAKLLAPDAVVTGAPLTRTGVRLLSPLYASPEQVEGGATTTATDVYALGVLLYELVTGHHPHEGEEEKPRTAREVERAIATEPPADPARAVTTPRPVRAPDGAVTERTAEEIARARATEPEALRRRVKGDLGAVLLKALRREPERRYTSAERLSDDLGRLLSGHPVTARRDTWRYRASKFVRRHAAGVAAAALVAISLVGGIVTTTWQARRAAEAAVAARLEARNAEVVTDLLVGLFEAPDAEEAVVGDTLTARAVLDRGVSRLREELAGQPTVRARMLHAAGRAFGNLGLFDRGRPLLREALELRRELYGDEHGEVAESLEELAALHRAERDFRAAVPLYREALTIRRALHPDSALQVANTAADLAFALRDVGRADTAVEVMREVLELKRRRLGPDHEEVLDAQAGLAYALRARGGLAEAESLYRDVLPRMRRAGGQPADLAATMNNLAFVLKMRGRLTEATEVYRNGLEEARRAHGPGHPNSLMFMTNLAGALAAAGDTAAAEATLRERFRLVEARYPDGHWRVGSAAGALGVVLTLQRRHGGAERYFRRALEIYEEELGPDHEWTVHARGRVGRSLSAQGRHAEAEPLLRRGRADRLEESDLARPWARNVLEGLVAISEAWGRDEEARRYRKLLAAVDSAGS